MLFFSSGSAVPFLPSSTACGLLLYLSVGMDGELILFGLLIMLFVHVESAA